MIIRNNWKEISFVTQSKILKGKLINFDIINYITKSQLNE